MDYSLGREIGKFKSKKTPFGLYVLILGMIAVAIIVLVAMGLRAYEPRNYLFYFLALITALIIPFTLSACNPQSITAYERGLAGKYLTKGSIGTTNMSVMYSEIARIYQNGEDVVIELKSGGRITCSYMDNSAEMARFVQNMISNQP